MSSSGVNGVSSASGEPSGLRRRIADNTRAGSRGTSTSRLMASLTCESRSINRRDELARRPGRDHARERLDRTRHDHSEVARQAVGRLRVGEGS